MTMATEYYDRLLAAHYIWMLGGDIATIAKDQARLLIELDPVSRRQRPASHQLSRMADRPVPRGGPRRPARNHHAQRPPCHHRRQTREGPAVITTRVARSANDVPKKE